MLSHLLFHLFTGVLIVTGTKYDNPHMRHHKDTVEMIREAGYTAETHTVITPDRYILNIHRIVGGSRGLHAARTHGCLLYLGGGWT